MKNRYMIKTNIAYIEELPQDSLSEYKELCRWICEKYEEDNREISKRNLKYLESSSRKIKDLLADLNKSSDDCNYYINLKKVEYKNKECFSEFILDIKDEYEYLRENRIETKDYYREYNKILSWYKLTEEYIREALRNLAVQKVDYEQMNFSEISINKNVIIDKEIVYSNVG